MYNFSNPARYEPNINQINTPKNNQLLYNAYNNIYPENNNLNNNLMTNRNSLPSSLKLTTNNSNFSTLSHVNNRKNSLDEKFDSNKKNNLIYIGKADKVKRNLSSSGILKASRRDKKYDKVIKKGKKLKNIDLNRDYDDNPDDDASSNIFLANNFKNKLTSKQKEDNSKTNNIKSLNENNNKANQSAIKKANTSFSVSKPKELNFSLINPHTSPNHTIENNVYNISINTIPKTEQKLNNLNSNDLVTNIDDYFKYQTYPFQEMINQELININPSVKGKGFKICAQLTRAGKNMDGLEKIDQDTPLISTNVGGVEGFNIFGVLDGHGDFGHYVSQFCKNYFVNKMIEYVESLVYITQFITAEEVYINLKANGFSYIMDLFLNIDSELSLQTFDHVLSGTTCNLIFQFNNHLVCFNVGDSRSILIEDYGDLSNQIIRPLSVDHKPTIPEEMQRIQAYGGAVERIRDIFGNELGPFRVFKRGCNYPGLAMSRSLGDLQAKECGVISNPQILEYDLNTNTKYLVVCSDGIWEFMTNEQVRDIGNKYYAINNAEGFCNELVNVAINIWSQKGKSRDDITVVAVFF